MYPIQTVQEQSPLLFDLTELQEKLIENLVFPALWVLNSQKFIWKIHYLSQNRQQIYSWRLMDWDSKIG